jgi:hypothetical protein
MHISQGYTASQLYKKSDFFPGYIRTVSRKSPIGVESPEVTAGKT